MTSSKYYETLGVSPGATQEEITKAYKRMALKYHPDRNHGNEEWAKQKFIEVGEAYQTLSKPSPASRPKKNYDFSGKSSAEKFKMAFEMMREMEKDLDRMEKENEENIKKNNEEIEEAIKESIQRMEKSLNSNGVSVSDLDPNLWAPYSDWKEKIRKEFGFESSIFEGEMRIAISKAKLKKNNSGSGKENYTYNDYSGQNYNYQKGKYDYGQPDYSNKNFSPNNGGRTGERKHDIAADIKMLEEELEYNKNYLLKASCESEKEKCRKIISEVEAKLRKFRAQYNPKDNSNNQSPDNSKSNSNESKDKDEKISQLESEIEQLKNQNCGTQTPEQRAKNQRKLAEKENELEAVKQDKKNNQDNSQTDNENYENLTREQLTKEIEKLKSEKKNSELTEKVSQIKKAIQQLIKEIQGLKVEVQELKNKKSRSEYENYYLSRLENQLKDKQSKLESLSNVIKSVNPETSNPNKSKFPVGWVIGGGTIFVVGLLAVMIIRKKKKK